MKQCITCKEFAENEWVEWCGYCPECMIKVCIEAIKKQALRSKT